MTRRLLTTAICAALIALLAATAASAGTPRTFYGVSSQTALKDREYKRMGQGRVGTLRSMLNWRAIDPTKADDDYQWGNFDNTVAAAARGKIEILPFIYGTPNWFARGIDGRHCGNCEQFAPRRAPARSAYAAFVGAAVERYGRGGEFWDEHPSLPREPITAWQIWNEQNSKTFYRPGPSVKGYAKLLDDAANAIRSRDRKADVVLGGMAELAGSRKATTASSYLAKLYRRKGARKDFDGVAVHPYGAKVSSVKRLVGLIHDVSQSAGDSGVGLWVTEIGWGSGPGSDPLDVGRSGQASRLSQSFRYFRSHRGSLNVKLVTWFSWRDSPTSLCSWCAKSGLFTKSLTPKPSWRAFTGLTGGR